MLVGYDQHVLGSWCRPHVSIGITLTIFIIQKYFNANHNPDNRQPLVSTGPRVINERTARSFAFAST